MLTQRDTRTPGTGCRCCWPAKPGTPTLRWSGRRRCDIGGTDEALLAEAAFMDTGRPALVIPAQGAARLPPRRALFAWDGSREAARAAGDAVGLLAGAEESVVLVVNPERRGQFSDQPGTGLVGYLGRHGIKARLQHTRHQGRGIAETILEPGPARQRRTSGHGRLRALAFSRDDDGRRHPLCARARAHTGSVLALTAGALSPAAGRGASRPRPSPPGRPTARCRAHGRPPGHSCRPGASPAGRVPGVPGLPRPWGRDRPAGAGRRSRQERPDALRPGAVDREGQHHDRPVGERGLQPVEGRHLLAAGRAPGGPQVEHHHLALERFEVGRLSRPWSRRRGPEGVGVGRCGSASRPSRRRRKAGRRRGGQEGRSGAARCACGLRAA